jgi:ADP-heptose:LPS heptosyltransferase
MAEARGRPTGERDAGRGPDPLRRVRRSVRAVLLRLLSRGTRDGAEPLPDLRSLRRILLVSVSPRLGNTVLATSGVAALADALPDAELHFLGGPTAPALLRGLRLARVQSIDRRGVWLPWRLLRLVRALRREHYDAAIHLSTATGSFGALLVGVSGARHRLGVRRAEGNVFFTTAVEAPEAAHKVDQVLELLRNLGVAASGERRLALDPAERAAAARSLEESFGAGGPPVAIFVGARARKGKVWPLAGYARVADGLRAQGIPLLVLLGPEELARESEIRAALGAASYRYEPDLRRVAALLAGCRAVLAPDSGPMHRAIAAGAPTVAVFVRANFERWGPRPPRGAVVYDPDGTRAGEALDAVLKLCAGTP